MKSTLFITFLKIGTFSFGGGYAMLPLIEREVIERHKWIDRAVYTDMLTLAQSAPGPLALNIAVFVGSRLRGFWGAAAAVAGVVLPSFVILLFVAIYLPDIAANRWVTAAFAGMRPAVIALIAAPLVKLCKGLSIWQIAAAIAVLALIWLLGISPIYLLLTAAIIGISIKIIHNS